MREITCAQIRQCTASLYAHASLHLPPDVLAALRDAQARETNPLAIEALRVALANAEAAAKTGLPLCQDTGLCAVFVELGQDVHVTGGLLTEAIQAGIADATTVGHLRHSVRCSLTGANTGTNTPGPVHIALVAGDGCRMTVAPKGAGSENKGRVTLLNPQAGLEGIRAVVLETVLAAGGAPCPPLVVGVGIGGNTETCALLAKKALLRPIGAPRADADLSEGRPLTESRPLTEGRLSTEGQPPTEGQPRVENHVPTGAHAPGENRAPDEPQILAELEADLLHAINQTGIGPQGFGGKTTALAVHALAAPTHIACLPVAVALQCHVARHASAWV